MKIEQINENQIRCTLSKNDLVERQLKISEIAYGSDKAKELFRDMMEQANIDFGFEADDIPLMIEAIPTSRESIVLVITKVDNPEEFDERFGRFGLQPNDGDTFDSSYEEEDSDTDMEPELLDSNSEAIVNCFEQLHELMAETNDAEDKKDSSGFVPLSEALRNKQKNSSSSKKDTAKKPETVQDKMHVYSFASIDAIIDAARLIPSAYSGRNSLWKNEKSGRYYLLMNRGTAKNAFRTACSLISEFGKEESITYATPYFFAEHYLPILKEKALKQLAQL